MQANDSTNQNSEDDSEFLERRNDEREVLVFKIDSEQEAHLVSGNPPINVEIWMYSYNNRNTDRDRLNFLFLDTTDTSESLDAEFASFAGNLYHLILNSPYPTYFSCKLKNADTENKDKFARISNKIDDFSTWQEAVALDKNKGVLSINGKEFELDSRCNPPIKGLTAVLVAGCFLDEQDWDDTNIGLANGQVVRVDPALTFGANFSSESTAEEISSKLSNLLGNFIYEITTGSYFTEYEDVAETAVIKELFNSHDELFETLAKIISLPKSLYLITALKSFSPIHHPKAFELVEELHARAELFHQVAQKMEGFDSFYAQYKLQQAADYHNQLVQLKSSFEFNNNDKFKEVLEPDIEHQNQFLEPRNQLQKSTSTLGFFSSEPLHETTHTADKSSISSGPLSTE
ncbi:hypothetical protein [Legionella maioricensis]|uniref:Uncharacterized protein n=1 Tax=Legionella maioricensis TaxID=2896528 RepID=A0A9X2CZ35_9GAMM|nr:hypothetical protein [Legionella maioricensis]MCL9683428.1 hypothetical protein [Legionella maioricensis]MCL9688599.1 hypothetical protein [Legionella maioricensis]